MTAKKLTIAGEFTEPELKRVVEMIQSLGGDGDKRIFLITLETDAPLASAEDALGRLMGEVKPGHKREIVKVVN